VPRKTSSKDTLAHQRMDDHEKLCRIMQEENNKKIDAIHKDINRLERIMLSSTAFIIVTLVGIVVAFIFNLK